MGSKQVTGTLAAALLLWAAMAATAALLSDSDQGRSS